MPPPKKPRKEAIKKAILEAYGNITVAAKALKVQRSNLYKWIEKDDLKEFVLDGREQLLDVAENKMAKKIEEDEDTTALIFFLKTQGKSRGYIERQENQQDNSGKIEIVVTRRVINKDPEK